MGWGMVGYRSVRGRHTLGASQVLVCYSSRTQSDIRTDASQRLFLDYKIHIGDQVRSHCGSEKDFNN